MKRLVIIVAAALLVGCNLYTELDRPTADSDVDASFADLGNGESDATIQGGGADAGAETDAEDTGTCTPQTDLKFCRVNGVDCGEFTAFDNCEQSRTVNCGMCEAGTTCGEQAPNVCGCPCSIDANCVGLGAINPNDDCQVCDPNRNSDDWSIESDAACTVFPVGEVVRIDFGPISAVDWVPLTNDTRTDILITDAGTRTTATAEATSFDGEQTGGSLNNDLDWPGEVSRDTLWVGTFDGHQAALSAEGFVRFEGLAIGTYEVRIFASRNGSDEMNGRLTRYEISGTPQDLDVQDNRGAVATFADVAVAEGTIEITVRVSPAGMSRFGYIGALELERVD